LLVPCDARARHTLPTRRSSDLAQATSWVEVHQEIADVMPVRPALGLVAFIPMVAGIGVGDAGAGEEMVRGLFQQQDAGRKAGISDRKSTRLNSSHVKISYAVFC